MVADAARIWDPQPGNFHTPHVQHKKKKKKRKKSRAEYNGRWYEKKNAYISMTGSLLYSRNWQNVVNQLYFNKKNLKKEKSRSESAHPSEVV